MKLSFSIRKNESTNIDISLKDTYIVHVVDISAHFFSEMILTSSNSSLTLFSYKQQDKIMRYVHVMYNELYISMGS